MQVVDFIEQIVSNIDFTYTVISFAPDGLNTAIVVKETFHAREDLLINQGTDDFVIVSVDEPTTTIVISGLHNLTGLTLVLQPPFYFHGVPIAVNNELSKTKESTDKTPFVYLLEIIREEIDDDELSAIEKIADIRIFFLDESDYKKWDTDEHYTNVIIPMRNLQEKFRQQLNREKLVGQFSVSNVTNHVNFGKYMDLRGHVQSIFNDRLSGVEMVINLPIRVDVKNCLC